MRNLLVLVTLAAIGAAGCRGALRGQRAPEFQPDPPAPPPYLAAAPVAAPPPPAAPWPSAPPPAPVFVAPAQVPAYTAPVELPPPAAPAAVVYQAPAAPPPTAPRVRRVTVDLLGVVAGPTKASGDKWDIDGDAIRVEDARDIAGALKLAVPQAAAVEVAAILARPTMHAVSKPDVAGRASLVSAAGEGAPRMLPKTQDAFTPLWPSTRFAHVPLDGTTRLRVTLTDMDFFEVHDPMGTFEIDARDLEAALRSGGPYPVPVAADTDRQILFARISVFEEPEGR